MRTNLFDAFVLLMVRHKGCGILRRTNTDNESAMVILPTKDYAGIDLRQAINTAILSEDDVEAAVLISSESFDYGYKLVLHYTVKDAVNGEQRYFFELTFANTY
jgi:hypothetical protein